MENTTNHFRPQAEAYQTQEAASLIKAAKTVFFSVGEPSGDRHAASLIKRLREASPEMVTRGFGGAEMRKVGCHIDYELTDLAVVGFVEVAPKLREFFRVADQASAVFEKQRPDAVVLVDFPGFNWHIAKRAKAQGIPVFYYLPPQLWAWGSWRIKKMRKYVDHVLCNLPFEQAWYSERDMSVDYVGHPFFDDLHQDSLDRQWMQEWTQHEAVQVAVLPGSRSREVKHIWPLQQRIMREVAARHPRTRFLVACLKDEYQSACQSTLTSEDRKLDIHFLTGKTSEIIEAADCSLMKSGSVSLEMMARGTPSVVLYHVSRALYEIARRLTDIDSITLPNMIAQETVIPEFLAVGSTNSKATATAVEKTIASLDRLVGDGDEREQQRQQLHRLSQQYATPGASDRAAEIILRELGMNHSKPDHSNVATEHLRAA